MKSGHRRINLQYWRRQTTEHIVQSLLPNNDPAYQEFLKVKPDGLIMQGNTRVTVLRERGYNVDELLPRFAADVVEGP
jgi:hypothetical protein